MHRWGWAGSQALFGLALVTQGRGGRSCSRVTVHHHDRMEMIAGGVRCAGPAGGRCHRLDGPRGGRRPGLGWKEKKLPGHPLAVASRWRAHPPPPPRVERGGGSRPPTRPATHSFLGSTGHTKGIPTRPVCAAAVQGPVFAPARPPQTVTSPPAPPPAGGGPGDGIFENLARGRPGFGHRTNPPTRTEAFDYLQTSWIRQACAWPSWPKSSTRGAEL